MKIAILMSTYNGSKYLREQIESILKQKGNFKIDLIVRDDGSTDSTQAILKEYELKNNIKWYEGENKGPAQSFIELIGRYKDYDYYAFADQDDYWLPNKLDRAIQNIKSYTKLPCVYFSNAELVDSNLKSYGYNVYDKSPKLDFNTLICAGGILGCTMVFNNCLAKIIQQNELPKKIIMHDFFVAALCCTVNGRIVFDDYVSMLYRQHGKNVIGVSKNIKNNIINRFKSILKKKNIGIDEQSKELLIYTKDLEKIRWLHQVIKYNNSIYNRILLSITRKTRYINLNMSLKIRLSILFGNR